MTLNSNREEIECCIRKLFLQPLAADQRALQITVRLNNTISAELQSKQQYLDTLRTGKDALTSILSEPERLVIQRHYVDGLDWPCVIEEFVQRWGEDARKTPRSLINHQNRGFRKMTDYVLANWSLYDFTWLLRLQ